MLPLKSGESSVVEQTVVVTDEQRLLRYLLRGYEKAVRPVTNSSTPVVVKLGLTLTNLFEMDEKNQVLTINVWLDQEWNDELLRWNPDDFNGIRSIRIPCDLIWLPDIVLYNNADDYTTGYMRSRAMVFYDGTVFWPPPTQLRSTCKIDVTYFPFDSQHCYLKFGSWSYHGFQVDVTNRSESVDLTMYVVSGEFDLVSANQMRRVVKYTCCPEPYPDVTFFFHIRRKTLYYLYNVVFPCLMMSVLTLLVFLLPPDSGEKIALGITVLLAFSVFVLAIAEKMPETSDSMPLIAIYLTIVMGMTSVSVVMTVMVLNFHHRGPFNSPVPRKMKHLVLERLRPFLRMKPPHITVAERNENRNLNELIRSASMKIAMEQLDEESKECDQQYVVIKDSPSVDPCEKSLIRLRKLRSTRLQARLLKALEMVLKKQQEEEEAQALADEWKQVAQVFDRLLFWIFLVCTLILTMVLLVIIPVCHRLSSTDAFDATFYGPNLSA
ncbi:hypothetical protein AB6A40_003419 [Gnathostoma spinigerum]|uniref:Uncharacterized protein n=1 Tax=Gnathostoma spinigerum TaxID=75299 RepID=A0ABD6EKB7_9BILA